MRSGSRTAIAGIVVFFRIMGDRLDPRALHGHAFLQAVFQIVLGGASCSRSGY
jgi:hypothetical protein